MRSNNIDVQHHFLREKIQPKEIDLFYCNTSENLVGIFTKPLGKMKFEICKQQIGTVENQFLH